MSGNLAIDRSGQGNDGTITNGPLRVKGKLGQALNFVRSSTQSISVPTNLQLQPPFSFSAWVNAADIPSGVSGLCDNYYPAIASDTVEGFGWNLTMGSPNGIGYSNFEIARWKSVSIWEGITSNATFTANTWYHVVGVYTPEQTSLYINGAIDKSTAASQSTLYYKESTSAIGKEGCGAPVQYFNGKLDDVRVYNRALTPDEVKRLYIIGGGR
jgi:hypothetical protein